MSRSSKIRTILLAGAALAVALVLLWAPRTKDARSANARKDSSASQTAAVKRHEAMALQAELQKKPDHVPILFRLAQLDRESGKPAEAIVHLHRILELEPKNMDARLELGRDLYETGDVTGALSETNQILIENPRNVDALYNMGAIYANVSKPAVAREYWTRAVSSDPNSESGKRAAEGVARLGASSR